MIPDMRIIPNVLHASFFSLFSPSRLAYHGLKADQAMSSFSSFSFSLHTFTKPVSSQAAACYGRKHCGIYKYVKGQKAYVNRSLDDVMLFGIIRA